MNMEFELLVLIWVIVSLVAATLGQDRVIGFWVTLAISIVLSPLIGFICVFAADKKSTREFQQKVLDLLSK